MGFITIIELNHDQADEIEQNKEVFIAQILKQMRSIQDFQQNIIGGKIILSLNRDHKDNKYKSWERFKNNWSKLFSIPKRNR